MTPEKEETPTVEAPKPVWTPLQRFAPGRDKDGKPALLYDMQGDWVRFDDHRRSLNTERRLADDRIAVERKAAKSTQTVPGPEAHPINPTIRRLRDAIRTLREEWDWSDADIVFAAELTPEGERTAATWSVPDTEEANDA